MSSLIEVTPSGTVGKQIFASDRPVVLKSIITTSTVSAGTTVIRDGNASGEALPTILQPVGSTDQISLQGVRFDKGMHVKVTGTGSKCVLEIE